MSAAAIKKQVEFYFSDSNYRKDTFLRAAAESDPEGFVPITTLLTFNKLKQMTTEVDKVSEALKDSDSVVLSADGKKLKRAEPLPDVDTSADRTLYVKGYPLEDADVTIESVAEQFTKYGKVSYVRLRRGNDKKFKGSCFVEFSSPAEMQAANDAANADGKMNLEYKGTPFLCVIPFKTWHANKQAKAEKRKAEKETTTTSNKRKLEDGADKEEEKAVTFESGLLVKITNLPSEMNVIEFKEFLKKSVEVKFVEYNRGDTFAVVRLGNAETATKLLDLVNGGLTFNDDVKLEGSLISGEEETAFWTKKASEQKNAQGKGGKGKGKKNFGNKRQRR